MRIVVGMYLYLTKVALLDLKSKLEMPYTYVRDYYDSIVLNPDKTSTLKMTQDGLVYLSFQGQIEDIPKWYDWIKKEIVSKIELLDEEDIFYQTLLNEKPPTIIILPGKEKLDTVDAFRKANRKFDYEIKTPKVHKEYGDGLVIFRNTKISEQDINSLIEHQIILADYQNLARRLLKYNKGYWESISEIRRKEKYVYKDLPELTDSLMDKRHNIDSVIHRIKQLDDTLESRNSRCFIKNILAPLKMDDYTEMIGLNNYLIDQFEMTKDYVSSTVELIHMLYQENEQKEFNILQVIFAIGTIASLVGLAGISDDEFVITQSGNQIIGQMFTFDVQSLIFWTGI